MDTEVVDIVDEHGVVLGQELKIVAHQKGLLHKTVIGYLRDQKNGRWTLVRQAAHKQDAGQLVAPVGGHIAAGETEEEALIRESLEEIGADNITFKLIGRKVFHREVIGRNENHLFVVYEISTSDQLALNDESVELQHFTSGELKRALKKSPQDFGDAYYFVLEHYYPDYLPQGYVNRYRLA